MKIEDKVREGFCKGWKSFSKGQHTVELKSDGDRILYHYGTRIAHFNNGSKVWKFYIHPSMSVSSRKLLGIALRETADHCNAYLPEVKLKQGVVYVNGVKMQPDINTECVELGFDAVARAWKNCGITE